MPDKPQNIESQDSEPAKPPQALLSLPAPEPETSSSKLDVTSSQTFRLDSLGPLVLNSDGTMSRINNWANMTEAERERTLRVLGKRNMLRKEKITNEDQETGAATEGESNNEKTS